MHENRETSGALRSFRDRGRSETAQSRTSDMHALEESDRTIVPMNQPNKEDSSSAEVGEGRVRTKENIAQSNTSPTQSGERVSQGLRGVRETAKARKQDRSRDVRNPSSGSCTADIAAHEPAAAPGRTGRDRA
jgi:RNA-directed DNA polymerase